MNTMRLCCAALVTFAAAVASASAADDRMTREIERLEQTLAAMQPADVPKEAADLFAVHRTALERAKRAPSPEYRLYRLRDPFIGIETLAFLAREKNARQSVERFRELWDASSARFAEKAPPPRGSLLERALAESATTRAERLRNASLPYAKAAEPWSGVYYLGEAQASLRFRDFVQSLAGGEAEPSPSRDAVAAALADLETRTLQFFAGDVTNQNLIAVSVRLKEARELLDAARIDGAALLAIEARAALSRRGGPSGTYPQIASRAGSIATMLEGWSADEEAPMSEALRKEVLPFANALFGRAPAAKETPRPQVTVTLVRWPYT